MLRAANATLQIESRGCGGVLFGSGFPVADKLVITNAHVVAGSRRHEVLTNKGVRAGASVVYFDPAHDLALLSVPDLPVKPLRLATAAARRGQEAVVIGYPGGGGQKFIGAEVVLRTQPAAPDIYSREQGAAATSTCSTPGSARASAAARWSTCTAGRSGWCSPPRRPTRPRATP